MKKNKPLIRNSEKKATLCCFSFVDYYIFASTLSTVLAEELSPLDLDILSAFFAVLSDELALASAVLSCTPESPETNDEVPDPEDLGIVIRSSHNKPKRKKRKKVKVKK